MTGDQPACCLPAALLLARLSLFLVHDNDIICNLHLLYAQAPVTSSSCSGYVYIFGCRDQAKAAEGVYYDNDGGAADHLANDSRQTLPAHGQLTSHEVCPCCTHELILHTKLYLII